jgi:hypothetical protein
MRFHWAPALLPLFFVLPAKNPTSSSKPPVIAIAGLLGGKTLVPLAQFAEGRWVKTWPQPGEEVERKLQTLGQIPRGWFPVKGGVPGEWFLWTQDLHGVPVRVGAPALAEAHCDVIWGLSTRLQPNDHETTAIATNVPTGVRPFNLITLRAEADDRLRVFLREEFEKAETTEIRAKRPDAETLLARRPDRYPVFKLNCVPWGEEFGELCSFEATRQLGTKPYKELADCDEFTVVQGWFLETPRSLTLVRAGAMLTDCIWKEVRSAVAMTLITANERTFVVVREHGYEDESFVVYELLGNQLKQVLEVAGGGC